MISQRMVELIEKNASSIAREWLRDIRVNVRTPFYHTFDEDRLYERAHTLYKRLGHWLSFNTPKDEIARHYKKIGWDRCEEGFPLAELIYSFILYRRHLWLYVLNSGFFDSAYELRQALELNNRIILFFDRAMYNVALGHEERRKKRED